VPKAYPKRRKNAARHQDVEALAGIDADVDRKGAGEGGFLIGGHGAALQGGRRRSDYVQRVRSSGNRCLTNLPGLCIV